MENRNGRKICDVLRSVREEIALRNGFPFKQEDCTYLGDCIGTCPKCEAELKQIESFLETKIQQGETVYLENIYPLFGDDILFINQRVEDKEISEDC